MNRINLITLGVRDLKKARAFYRDGLGFVTANNEAEPKIIFFDNNGTKLALYPLQLLAEDIDAQTPPSAGKGFAGITLAYNAKTKQEVDAVFAVIEDIGGTIAKAPPAHILGRLQWLFSRSGRLLLGSGLWRHVAV